MGRYCLALIVLWCTLLELGNGLPVSPAEDQDSLQTGTEYRIRQKRHISEQLLLDKALKLRRSAERSYLIQKLVQLVGSDSCKCKTSRYANEDRPRTREKRRFRAAQSRGCTCDMMNTLRLIYRKVEEGWNGIQGDPFSMQLSKLDYNGRKTLLHIIHKEIRRIRQVTMSRQLRARARARALRRRKYPNRAPLGINLFMG